MEYLCLQSIYYYSLTIFLLFCVHHFLFKTKNALPEPKGYPFIGPLVELIRWNKFQHHLLEKWAKELGDVYQFKIFGRKFLVLNSVDVIYEALVHKGNVFSGKFNII